jgi:hypothetical protein
MVQSSSLDGVCVETTQLPVWYRVEMEFNVRPVAKTCASTGEELAPGCPCWSVLIEEDGRIARYDYSPQAWTGPPDGVIGYWECMVPDRTTGPAQVFDTDSLFTYFLQLCESPNKVEQDYQYVLALLLLRKRRLLLEESVFVDGEPTMRLIGAKGEGPFDVVERDLPDGRIEELQNQLFQDSAA